jgi:hypothetical protein
MRTISKHPSLTGLIKVNDTVLKHAAPSRCQGSCTGVVEDINVPKTRAGPTHDEYSVSALGTGAFCSYTQLSLFALETMVRQCARIKMLVL